MNSHKAGIMVDREFEALKRSLVTEMLTAVADRMKARGLTFDREAFLRQTSIDLEQNMVDILTFGCDVWPTTDGGDGTFALAA